MSIGTPILHQQFAVPDGGTSSASFTPGADNLLILIIDTWSTPAGAFGVSGQADGSGWHLANDDEKTDEARHLVYTARTAASPSAGTVSITTPAGRDAYAWLIEVPLSGGAFTAANALQQVLFDDSFGATMGASLLAAPTGLTIAMCAYQGDVDFVTLEGTALGVNDEVSPDLYSRSAQYSQAGDQQLAWTSSAGSIVWAATILEVRDPAGAANNDPTLDSPEPDLTVSEGATGSTDLSANFSDADLDTLTYSVSPALPSGFSLNATTGVLSWNGTQTTQAATAYTVTADDGQGGTPAQDTFNITVTAPALNITSVTTGAIYTGDAVTIGLENANATGKTLTIAGQAITADSQSATQIVFTAPDPKAFGNQRLDYNNPLTIQVTDGGNSDTVDFQITPDIGHYYATIAELGGIFVDDVGVVVGDKAYGYWVSGTGAVSLAYGALSSPNGGTFRYWLYDVSDNGGTWGGSADEVFVDSVAPIITLTGDTTVNINEGDAWSDPGYSATDNVDGDLTGSVVVAGDTVDPNTIGSYVITYNVSDAAGNPAVQRTRTVNVVDVTAPTISLLGTTPVTHPHGTTYVDAGYTASDNNDGDITGNVVVTGSVNPNVVGQYTLSFNVSDAAGNPAATVFRTVNVTDQAAPTITLVGANPLNINLGSSFTDPGATATDAVDGDLTGSIVITGTVNPNVAGSYTRRYNVSDAAGNAATEVARTVNVVADATAPVITLVGGAVNLDEGDTFTEPGYSATDNVDGDLTSSVIVGGSVDTNTPGIYLLTYDVTDSSGNAAAQRNRLVTVSGTVVTPPLQSSDSWKIQLVQPSATYTDPVLTGILDSQSQDVSGTAVWDGEAVDTQAALNTRVNVTTTNGVIEDAAAGQVSFTPDGSLPRGRYQYEAKGLDANGDPVTFSIGTYTVS